MKDRCSTRFYRLGQCIGEAGHPSSCLFEGGMAMGGFDFIFPAGLNEMYGIPDDPMKESLPATRADDWSTKDRHIEWVLHNFTEGMLAKMYKLLHDGRGIRRDRCDDLIKKG